MGIAATAAAGPTDLQIYLTMPTIAYKDTERIGSGSDEKEMNKCIKAKSDAKDDDEFVSDQTVHAAQKVAKFARRQPFSFGSCVFYAGQGRIEIVYQTESKRLSLFVDGESDTIKSIRYDRVRDHLDTKIFKPILPGLLKEELCWIFEHCKSNLYSEESQQTHTSSEMNETNTWSLPALST